MKEKLLFLKFNLKLAEMKANMEKILKFETLWKKNLLNYSSSKKIENKTVFIFCCCTWSSLIHSALWMDLLKMKDYGGTQNKNWPMRSLHENTTGDSVYK